MRNRAEGLDAMRINYNYVREHSTIGKTSAEKAGIKLNLGENKIENLIRLASKHEDKPQVYNIKSRNPSMQVLYGPKDVFHWRKCLRCGISCCIICELESI